MMTNSQIGYAIACCLLFVAGDAAAVEIVGQVGAVDDKGIAVLVGGNVEPQPGDMFVVTVEVPGVGTAAIAEGQVNTIDAGIVLGRITAATGKVSVGQQVKFNSPQAVNRGAPPAATTVTETPPARAAGSNPDTILSYGITLRDVDAATAEFLDLPSSQGFLVTAVVAGSPAETAGLKKRDVFRTVNGTAITAPATLEQALSIKSARPLSVEVWRDGAMQTLRLKRVGDTQARVIPAWGEVVDPAGDCRIVEAEGRLTITVPGTPTSHDLNPVWEYNNMTGPRVLHEVEGDFQAQVLVRPFAQPTPNTATGKTIKVSYVGAGLLIWLDEKTFVRHLRAASGERGTVSVHLEAFRDAHSHKVTYAPGDARKVSKDKATYLRVERRGDELTFSTSVDGKQWAAIGSVSELQLPQKLRCGVGVVNATNKDFAPEFVEFALTGG